MNKLKVFLAVLFIAFGVMVIVPNISRAEMMKDDKGMMKGDGMMNEDKMMNGDKIFAAFHGLSMNKTDRAKSADGKAVSPAKIPAATDISAITAALHQHHIFVGA